MKMVIWLCPSPKTRDSHLASTHVSQVIHSLIPYIPFSLKGIFIAFEDCEATYICIAPYIPEQFPHSLDTMYFHNIQKYLMAQVNFSSGEIHLSSRAKRHFVKEVLFLS